MAKLQWEWSGDYGSEITIRKAKGKITFDELFRFFHERDMLNLFDGDIIVVSFCVHAERDMYDYNDIFGEPAGDSLDVQVVQDDTVCPICGAEDVDEFYLHDGEIVGCSECIRCKDAYDYTADHMED